MSVSSFHPGFVKSGRGFRGLLPIVGGVLGASALGAGAYRNYQNSGSVIGDQGSEIIDKLKGSGGAAYEMLQDAAPAASIKIKELGGSLQQLPEKAMAKAEKLMQSVSNGSSAAPAAPAGISTDDIYKWLGDHQGHVAAGVGIPAAALALYYATKENEEEKSAGFGDFFRPVKSVYNAARRTKPKPIATGSSGQHVRWPYNENTAKSVTSTASAPATAASSPGVMSWLKRTMLPAAIFGGGGAATAAGLQYTAQPPGLLDTVKDYGNQAMSWAKENPGYAAAAVGVPTALAAYYMLSDDDEEKNASVVYQLGCSLGRSQ